MRVLVTGHRGYIGAVLVSVLRHARHEVVGLDTDLYRGCDFGRVRDEVPSFEIDVREVEFADLLSFDAVIHLAALPEDFSGGISPNLTWEVNAGGAVRLAECCKQAGVSRLLFASTCAVYGAGRGGLQDETSEIKPISAYAEAKAWAETQIVRMASPSFTPVVLRNATVYGVSPRLRLDTVVNDFVGSAVARGRVESQTDGRAWRPLVHVEDIARAYAGLLGLEDAVVRGEVFNVAPTEENYRIADVADLVSELVPDCGTARRADSPDRRSYSVEGSKLRRALPGFTWRWTLPQGIRQLRAAMAGAGLASGEWRSQRFRRVLNLQSQLEQGELNASLRRAAGGCAAMLGPAAK